MESNGYSKVEILSNDPENPIVTLDLSGMVSAFFELIVGIKSIYISKVHEQQNIQMRYLRIGGFCYANLF